MREGEWSRKGKETVRLGRAVRKGNGERSRRERGRKAREVQVPSRNKQ